VRIEFGTGGSPGPLVDGSQMETARMDPRIERLFADYGKSFDALEMRRVAQLYAKDFVAAGPKGTISQSRDTFLANADKAAEFYRSVGQESAEMRSARETWFGDKYAMVTIHWAVRFKTILQPVEFDVSYLVQLTDEKPQIILFISHEDEEEAMRKLGLLAQRPAS
jgi:hypothetical protein